MAVNKRNPGIAIFSLDDMLQEIYFNKTDWNIVSIRDSDHAAILYQDFYDCRRNYGEIIIETFDDIIDESSVLRRADAGQVRRILEWSEGKNKIAVHCHMGISRSSAIAYLIACTRMPERKALEILDFSMHYPNRHIVYLGASMLGREAVYRECMDWLEVADKKLMKTYFKNAKNDIRYSLKTKST